MKTIGEKIRDRRMDLGKTQDDLAAEVEVSRRTLSKYETDAVTPRGLNMRRLCKVLGVSEAYLTNPEIEDVTYGLEEAPYLDSVREAYGKKAATDLEGLLQGVQAAFAGGDVPQADKDKFFQAVTEAYFATKEDAHERFTPKKYRK